MKENSRIKNHDSCLLLLKLFESQLDGARQEMLARANELGVSFESLFDVVNELQHLQNNNQNITPEEISNKCENMNGSLVTCVSSLQFTDAICQRIDHLSAGIKSVRKLLDDEEEPSDSAWDQLTDEIRNSYSVVEEREIFDQVIHGVSSNTDDACGELF